MAKSPKIRLDRLLVVRELAPSEAVAAAVIVAGKVVVGDHTVDKPGTLVRSDANVRLRDGSLAFVSRGGLKLRGALDQFVGLPLEGRVAMDVGASTGGFTDCLLQAGVRRVYAVDVGYGQLAWKLVQDPRVVVLDRSNIRTLAVERVGEPVDVVVVDCSFISLRQVLPSLPQFLAASAEVVALIKPQFEVEREQVEAGGLVRDDAVRQAARERVVVAAEALGFAVAGTCEAAVAGHDGNREFLVWLRWRACEKSSG